MKRIISTSLCAIFTLGLFAQKALIIHKTDGTKVEIPMEALQGFGFSGKAIVNDDDYVQLTDLQLHSGTALDITLGVSFHTDDPYLSTLTNLQYGQDWGILYATTPDVSLDNGELVVLVENQIARVTTLNEASLEGILFGESKTLNGLKNPSPIDLEFESTYYFRAFVRRPASDGSEETYFYSKEQSLYTDKPTMRYYGVDVDPALYAESGYVMVSAEAWTAFMAQYPHFAGGEPAMDIFSEVWSEYLTKQRIEQLKPQCTTVYECCDGIIYVLDAVGEDFAEYLLAYCNQPIILSGYADKEHYGNAIQTHVKCSEALNVPNNEYWEYKSSLPNNNPKIRFDLGKPLMANYRYKLEITFATDTLTDKDAVLPIKYRTSLQHVNGEGAKKTYSLGSSSHTIQECTTVAVEKLESTDIVGFGNAILTIEGAVSAREKNYDRTLRIAQVKVTLLGPSEE